MTLTVRATRAGDLPACLEILHGRYAYSADVEATLDYWRYVLAARVGVSRLVTDVGRSSDEEILAFGLGVFVTEAFMQGALTTLPPHLGLQAVRSWRSGQRVSLNRREIARENSGAGLNLLVIAYGTKAGLPPARDLDVRSATGMAFLECFAGYRLRCIAQETHGTEFDRDMLSAGWRALRSYPTAPPVASCGRTGPPTHLYGIVNDGVEDVGFYWWKFFHPPDPYLGFTEPERETLEQALENETDEEIARSLDVSIWTVKKRWQNIYSKVEALAPAIFPAGAAVEERPGQGVAGGERRRHLLAYLRQHPEEIRPRAEASK